MDEPRAWAASNADAICETMSTARTGVSRPNSVNSARNVWPSTKRMSMKRTPSISPQSCTGITCGSFRAAVARDSRRKRAWNDGSAASSRWSNLSATRRSFEVSYASYTSPIPPRPRRLRNSYTPNRVPDRPSCALEAFSVIVGPIAAVQSRPSTYRCQEVPGDRLD